MPAQRKSVGADYSLTIGQFCHAENISKRTFYNLIEQGQAPDLLRALNGVVRITAASRQRWHKRMERRQRGKHLRHSNNKATTENAAPD